MAELDDCKLVGGYCTVGYQSKCRFRIRSEKNFNTANFESLPRAQKLVFYHEIFTKELSLSQLYVCQISRSKDSPKKSYSKSINIGSCGNVFTATNFDSLPKIELFFFCHEILGIKTSLC